MEELTVKMSWETWGIIAGELEALIAKLEGQIEEWTLLCERNKERQPDLGASSLKLLDLDRERLAKLKAAYAEMGNYFQ